MAPFTTVEYFAPFFPGNAKNRLIAMLRAYLDDSGTHTDGRSRMVVCGGVLIEDTQHDYLKPSWTSVLSKHGLPFFHMTRYKARKDEPYVSMSDSDYGLLLERLLLIMRCRVRYCFAAIMPVSIYEETLTQVEKVRYGNEYAWAIQMAWTMIRVWADRHNYYDPIPFLVEAGTKGEKDIDQVFNRLFANQSLREQLRLHSLTAGSKVDFPGLQAADITANSMYELNTYFRANGRQPSDAALTVSKMLDNYVEVRQIVFDSTQLRAQADALNIQYPDEIIEKADQ